MESLQDKWRAFGYSVLVHLLVVAVVTVGVWWTRSAVVVAIPGPVIEATLVGPAAAPKASKPKPRKPAPPKPEPDKPKPVEAPEPPKEDTRDQQRIAALAAEKAEQDAKEQVERRKREQLLLEEEKKKLLQEKQLKAQAEKDKKLELQRLAELMEAEEAMTGQEGKDDSLEAQYFAAIRNTVNDNWMRPESAQAGLQCRLRIIQIPGGDVINVAILPPCNADPLTQDSLIQAVKRGALPYRGYEPVFRREFNFDFRFDG